MQVRHWETVGVALCAALLVLSQTRTAPAAQSASSACMGVTSSEGEACPVFLLELSSKLKGAKGLPGLALVEDDDIVAYDSSTGTYEFYFDGSDVGLSGGRIDGLAVLGDGSLLLSSSSAGSVSGLAYDDSDILRFRPLTLGEETSGFFELYFDGSDVGLSTGGEDIDALTVNADGDLVVSLSGRGKALPGLEAERVHDEDLLVFHAESLGADTAGHFSFLYRGGELGLTKGGEDINAVSMDRSGAIAFSTVGNFAVSGLAGGDEDLTGFESGEPAPGSFSRVFVGADIGLPRKADIGGVARLIPEPPASVHAVDVSLPVCDPTDPEVRILTPADVASLSAILNDEAGDGIRIFCLEPGDYSAAGSVTLTASGTALMPRVVRIHSATMPGLETRHPANLPEQARARLYRLNLLKADHWIIDGLTIDGGPGRAPNIVRGASHNIFQRLLIERGDQALLWFSMYDPEGIPSEYNVVQRSVLRNADISSGDDICIGARADPSGAGIAMRGNVFVDNEIYDCTQSIQLVCCTGSTENDGPFPGTIIDNNDLYVSPARYCDGDGNLDPDGAYACSEAPLTLKKGGTAEDPVVVTNNRMWGARPTDPVAGGSGSQGALAVFMLETSHVFFENNVLFDGVNALVVAPKPTEFGGLAFLRNQIFDMRHALGSNYGASIRGDRIDLLYNVFAEVDRNWLEAIGSNGGTLAYRNISCNVARDSALNLSGVGYVGTANYNAYYDATAIPGSGPDDIVGVSDDSGLEELCLQRKRITDREEFCIPAIRTTASSPHAGICALSEYRCEKDTGLPSVTACGGASDATSCAGIGPEVCAAYPPSLVD